MRKTLSEKERNKRLIIKSLILVLLFLSTNIIWIIFFHHDPQISFNLGIICPILYGFFYFLIKKSRRKLKSKIKAFIYIPIMYTLFGIIWLFLSLGVAKITHRSENIQASETVIEKLEFKNFFLFNYNLSYISRIPYMLENKSWAQSHMKVNMVMKSKYQTNNMILFIALFILQSMFILLTENIIYPYLKPEHKKHHKRRRSGRRSPPRDTFISDEKEIFLNFGNQNRDKIDENKFPNL